MLFKGYLSCKRNTTSKHTFQIMRSSTNMDEEVTESMKSFIQTSMMTIDNEVRKCNLLKDELHVCKRAIKDLNSKISNLELEAVRQKTCRVSVFDNAPLKSGGRMVVEMRKSRAICAIVSLTSEDPCPTHQLKR
jgi:hypothetical protein